MSYTKLILCCHDLRRERIKEIPLAWIWWMMSVHTEGMEGEFGMSSARKGMEVVEFDSIWSTR